jgi:hypothetical protein
MRIHSFLALPLLGLGLLLVSCKSASSKPRKMPNIPVTSTAAPPRHSLSRGEYPFDAQGNYVSAWAAEGEQRAGRSATYGTDYSTWQSSHGGARGGSSKKTTSSTSTRKKSSPSSSTSSKKKSTPTKSSSSTVSHTVKSGDTLYGLALRYKSSVAKIKAANGLKSDLIRPGQTLRIPR